MNTMAIYTYCLLRQPAEDSLPSLRGIDGRPVFPLHCEKYTMLVSRLERDFAFSARSIVEHGQVIARVFENRTVLPMRFGTFFRSERQVIELVRGNRQDLLEAFCRLRGKAEMHLKLLLGFEATATTSKVSEFRKPPRRSLGSEEYLPQPEGEPLDAQCRELAVQLSTQMREMFQPLEQQVSCRRLEGSQLLVDCAHLIETGKVAAYHKLCDQAANRIKDCDFRVSGPWPPYHFLPNAVRLPARPAAPAQRSRMARLANVAR
jgi:hypothetical protein